jgi:hypothetical protein
MRTAKGPSESKMDPHHSLLVPFLILSTTYKTLKALMTTNPSMKIKGRAQKV